MEADSQQAIGADDLLSLAREMSDAAAEMRAIRTQSSVVINAGGVTNAVSLSAAVIAIILVGFGAGWVMLKQSSMEAELARTRQDLQDQQAAWVAVMQQRISETKK